jgi:hypothetical protein
MQEKPKRQIKASAAVYSPVPLNCIVMKVSHKHQDWMLSDISSTTYLILLIHHDHNLMGVPEVPDMSHDSK